MRSYAVQFNNVSVSAAQDLVGILSTSAMAFRVVSIVIGQKTQTSIGNLRITCRRNPATVTVGSGGSAATPQQIGQTKAATVTARTNDTVQQTTSGTQSVFHSDTFNPINGYQWIFPERNREEIGLSEGFSLSLDDAPAAAMTMNVTVVIEELF